MKINQSSRERGFTLIELMIVVAIIGILAAVAIPKFADMLRKSKEGATKGSASSVRSALSIYAGDNDGNFPLTFEAPGFGNDADFQSSMVPKYLDSIPSVKIGTYAHGENNPIRYVYGIVDGNRSSITAANNPPGVNPVMSNNWSVDDSAWDYSSSVGANGWWVNCTHSDSKNNWVTTW